MPKVNPCNSRQHTAAKNGDINEHIGIYLKKQINPALKKDFKTFLSLG